GRLDAGGVGRLGRAGAAVGGAAVGAVGEDHGEVEDAGEVHAGDEQEDQKRQEDGELGRDGGAAWCRAAGDPGTHDRPLDAVAARQLRRRYASVTRATPRARRERHQSQKPPDVRRIAARPTAGQTGRRTGGGSGWTAPRPSATMVTDLRRTSTAVGEPPLSAAS